MKNFPAHPADEIFDNIKVISACPACGNKYYSGDAKILEEKESGHLVHIQCKRCKSSVVALILSNGMGISSISLVTDLTSDDVLKFKDRIAITTDDVIDSHIMLKNNEIDFRKL